MRRWASLLLLLLFGATAGCGESPGWQPVAPRAESGGLRVSLLFAIAVLDRHPWRDPPQGTSCLTYWVNVQSVDGRRHELRPDAFRVGQASPANAVGLCNGLQLEPTWVGSDGRTLPITVLTHSGRREPLFWRPG